MTVQTAAEMPPNPDPKTESAAPASPAGERRVAGARPLLECLAALARLFGRPASPDSLSAGLPLDGGDLSPALFARAAAKAGLACRQHQRAIQDISPIVLPAVLLLKDGSACLLVGMQADGGDVEVLLPETGGGSARLSPAALEARYSGTAIFVKPEFTTSQLDEAGGGNLPRPNRWFFGVVRRFWPTYGEAVLAAALVNVLALAVPLFTMNVYDRVIPNQAIPTLWVLAIGVMLALSFDFILRGVRAALIDNAGRRADILLSARIFEQVMNLQMRARPISTGAFANQLREFETVRDFFTSATLSSVTDLLFIGLFITIIWMIAGPVALVPALAVPTVIVIGLAAQFPLIKAVRESQIEAAQKHAVLVETVGNLETIKTLGAEGWRQGLWERFVGKTARTAQRARFWSALSVNLSALIQQLVVVGVIVMGVYRVAGGDMSVGALVAATILAGRSVAPLSGIANTVSRFHQSRIALAALDKTMSLPVDRPAGRTFISRPITQGAIEFRNVSFAYPGASEPALRNVSLSIKPGERVAIIGKVGCGKTTVGRLIAGLYEPAEGSVLIDGVDLRQMDPADVRRGIGFLMQDVVLFQGTIRENITAGRPHADDAAIIRAAELAGVDSFVRAHPQGYDAPVGERGQNLSGGQRQAIGLARSLLADPQVLVLDEPTSAMDTGSEGQLVERLPQILSRGQTLLITTHRTALLAAAARLIVMDSGQIVADGPRDAVLAALRENRVYHAPPQGGAAQGGSLRPAGQVHPLKQGPA